MFHAFFAPVPAMATKTTQQQPFSFRHCLLLLAFSFTPAAPRLAHLRLFSHLFGLACLLHFLFRFGCPEKLYTHICCASIGVSLCVCVWVCTCAQVYVCVCVFTFESENTDCLVNLPNCLALLSMPACCPTLPRALSLSLLLRHDSRSYTHTRSSLFYATWRIRSVCCLCVWTLLRCLIKLRYLLHLSAHTQI